MLKLENISVNFQDFSLKKICLEVPKGEYHVLLGPSGSGKTLILNCIAGFQNHHNGKIIYKNKDISKEAPNKRGISFLFQDLALFPHLNVSENIEYPLKIKKYKKAERQSKVNEYLNFTEIYHLKDRQIGQLSGGEKQRVAIARSLVSGTDMLLLDEPFSAIDSQLLISLKKLLKKISAAGISVIHVTHNFEEAINMAQKISIINNGEIIQTGTVDEIFNAPKNSFIAIFSGNKNFFNCKQVITLNESEYVLVPKIKTSDNQKDFDFNEMYLDFSNKSELEKYSSDYLIIEILPEKNQNIQGIILDSQNIIISEKRNISSARNNFPAYVENIFPTKSGYDIEVFCGVNFWISLTKSSFENLKVEQNKKVYISFKASAVKLI